MVGDDREWNAILWQGLLTTIAMQRKKIVLGKLENRFEVSKSVKIERRNFNSSIHVYREEKQQTFRNIWQAVFSALISATVSVGKHRRHSSSNDTSVSLAESRDFRRDSTRHHSSLLLRARFRHSHVEPSRGCSSTPTWRPSFFVGTPCWSLAWRCNPGVEPSCVYLVWRR